MSSQWQGFAHAVQSAALFMSSAKLDGDVIKTVQVRWDSERNVNIATATDRFMIGEQTFGGDTPPDPESWSTFLVGRDDVATLVKNGDPTAVRVEDEKVTLTYPDGGSWSFVSVAGEYPAVSQLWDRAKASGEVDHVLFNPALLARLAKVTPYNDGKLGKRATVLQRHGATVRFEFQDPTLPARAHIGDRFRALIMPVREAA